MLNNFQPKIRAAALMPLACALAFAAVSSTGMTQTRPIHATVDGGLVTFPDVQPIMIKQRIMVPVRGIFEYMDATVTWDESTKTVHAKRGTDHIILPLNSRTATMNDHQVSLDAPAMIYGGRTLVPLRFLSEALGAKVQWVESQQTVAITTTPAANNGNNTNNGNLETIVARIDPGTVIPFMLSTKLSSTTSRSGDRFTAVLDSEGSDDYAQLPSGTKLGGRVSTVSAMEGETPGVLGLEFDRVTLPNGRSYPISGALHGLDGDSVTNDNGTLTAKPSSRNNNLKFVGIGAGAGALVAILTKGNVLSNSLIGAALGLVISETTKDTNKPKNVVLNQGTKFGVRLTNDLAFRITPRE